jgi:plasmid stabilization system protein ParE
VDYEVILTEPARDDLREIVAFIAEDNPQAAVTFRDRLIAEAETLVRFPHTRANHIGPKTSVKIGAF